jgi:DNA-binding Lrp family transcriptional regulator
MSQAPSRPQKLTKLDRSLLRALARDARATGSALAAATGASESTVSQRLRALRATGVIRGYRADVDLRALGAPLQAIVAVRLGSHSRADVDSFRARVGRLPGVLSVFHVGGDDDYLLHVAASDADGLRDFVLDHLATHPAVQHTTTNLIFEHAAGEGWHELMA